MYFLIALSVALRVKTRTIKRKCAKGRRSAKTFGVNRNKDDRDEIRSAKRHVSCDNFWREGNFARREERVSNKIHLHAS